MRRSTGWAGFSADSRRLLTFSPAEDEGRRDYASTYSRPGAATWWDVETLTEVGVFPVEALPIRFHAATRQLIINAPYPHGLRGSLVVDAETGAASGAINILPFNRNLTWGTDWAGTRSEPAEAAVVIIGGTVWHISSLEEEPPAPASEEAGDLEKTYWIAMSPAGDRLLCKAGPFNSDFRNSAPDRVEIWDRRRGELIGTADHELLLGSDGAFFVSEDRFLTLGPPCYCPPWRGL